MVLEKTKDQNWPDWVAGHGRGNFQKIDNIETSDQSSHPSPGTFVALGALDNLCRTDFDNERGLVWHVANLELVSELIRPRGLSHSANVRLAPKAVIRRDKLWLQHPNDGPN